MGLSWILQVFSFCTGFLGVVSALPTATGDAISLPIRWPYLFYRLEDCALRRHIHLIPLQYYALHVRE
jgi:hypothetical protein